jgi:hypothetical protein
MDDDIQQIVISTPTSATKTQRRKVKKPRGKKAIAAAEEAEEAAATAAVVAIPARPPRAAVKNSVKSTLLRRLRDHKQQLRAATAPTADEGGTNREFKKAIKYFDTKSSVDQLRRHTQRNHHHSATEEKPWGCLKNGRKKTYRAWVMDQEKPADDDMRPPTPPLAHVPDDDPLLHDRDRPRMRVKRTMRRSFRVGKLRSNPTEVIVRTRDFKTQRNVQRLQKDIRNVPCRNARYYLKHRGILRSSSSCPDELLMAIFENSLLAGDITNVNPATLLHNMVEDSKQEIK